jgi:hypothetical protein
LRIALREKNVDLINEKTGIKIADGMVEMLQGYLKTLLNGELEIANQITEQLPPGWEEQEEKQHQADLAALRAVWRAISISTTNEECEAALQRFRDHLKPNGVITTGFNSSDKLLLAARELGHNKCSKFDDRKNDLFYIKVIGFIQRRLSAVDAMAHAQGFWHLFEKGEKLKHSLEVRMARLSFFQQVTDSPGLGFDYFVSGDDQFGGVHCMRGWFSSSFLEPGPYYKALCRTKTTSLQRIMQQLDNHSKDRCVVM